MATYLRRPLDLQAPLSRNEEEDRSGLYIDFGSNVGSVSLVFSDGEELLTFNLIVC
jgi:hypothetical protein